VSADVCRCRGRLLLSWLLARGLGLLRDHDAAPNSSCIMGGVTDKPVADVAPSSTGGQNGAVRWFSRAVGGIGLASFLSDVRHEVPRVAAAHVLDAHA
jgi:hypothetical protein